MQQVSCWRGRLTRCLTALLLGAVLNMSGPHMSSVIAASHKADSRRILGNNPASAAARNDTPFQYGIDRDKVPFARKADGTRARFLSLCPSHIKLQISGRTGTGDVEFRRVSPTETLVTYAPAGEAALAIRSTFAPQASSDTTPAVDLALELKGRKVVLSLNSKQGQVLSPNTEAAFEAMRADAKASEPLQRLLADAQTFLSQSTLSGLIPFLRQLDNTNPTDCKFDCARSITSCLAAVTTYLGGIGGLAFFCGETLGFTCVLAILSHPILAGAVGLECSNAANVCKACKNSGNAGPNSDWMTETDFWDDYWYSWMTTDDFSYQLHYRFQLGVEGIY